MIYNGVTYIKSVILEGYKIAFVENGNLEFYGFNLDGDAFSQLRSGTTYFFSLFAPDHKDYIIGKDRRYNLTYKIDRKLIIPV